MGLNNSDLMNELLDAVIKITLCADKNDNEILEIIEQVRVLNETD